MTESRHDRWLSGDAHEAYVGRWSRRVAVEFLDWLALPAGLDLVDVGSGTGAIVEAILTGQAPRTRFGRRRMAACR